MITWKHIDTAVCGALCLLLGWGTSTLVHELFHLMAARSLGLEATIERCTLSTGLTIINSPMTPTETTIVAIAGSIGVIAAGILLTKNHNRYIRMIGIIFLCRAWIDALPICGRDGSMIAGSAGYMIAVSIVAVEVLICGGTIYGILQKGLCR